MEENTKGNKLSQHTNQDSLENTSMIRLCKYLQNYDFFKAASSKMKT
jgi:hypothetical protein